MIIEDKSLMDLAGWLVSLGLSVGGTVAWVKLKLKSHDERLMVVEKKIETDIAEVNGKFFTPEGEPRLLSYKAHDHICTRTNELLTKSLQHVTTTLETHSKHVSASLDAHSLAVKSCGEQVANLTVAVAVIEDRFENDNKNGQDARG